MKSAGGKIDFLGEEERHVFGGTMMLEIMGEAVSNLTAGIEAALPVVEGQTVSATRRRTLHRKLKRLLKTGGLPTERLALWKRRTRAAADSSRIVP